MDQTQARVRLDGERARLQRLLAETDEPQAAELGDEVEDADRRNADQTSTAIDQLLRARWVALQRAEARLAAGKSKLRLLTWTLLICGRGCSSTEASWSWLVLRWWLGVADQAAVR
jgi:hypothetical protein